MAKAMPKLSTPQYLAQPKEEKLSDALLGLTAFTGIKAEGVAAVVKVISGNITNKNDGADAVLRVAILRVAAAKPAYLKLIAETTDYPEDLILIFPERVQEIAAVSEKRIDLVALYGANSITKICAVAPPDKLAFIAGTILGNTDSLGANPLVKTSEFAKYFPQQAALYDRADKKMEG